MKPVFKCWANLGINAKFTLVFGLLLVFMGLLAVASYQAVSFVRHQTQNQILTSTEIRRGVLAMKCELESARLAQGDFFLHYPRLGIEKATQQYVQAAVRHFTGMMSLSAELRQRMEEARVSQALKSHYQDLNLYLASAQEFCDQFLESVRLVNQLARPKDGLQARLLEHSAGLGELLTASGTTEQYHRIQSLEKSYWLTSQPAFMEGLFSQIARLRQALDRHQRLPEGQKARIQAHLEEYQRCARQVLAIADRIETTRQRFDRYSSRLDPITEKLLALAQKEVRHAQAQIRKAAQWSSAILVFIAVFGVLLVTWISRLMDRSITQQVHHLTRIAGQIQSGDLKARAWLPGKDELGQLGRVFNQMTEQLQDLVENLEHKVASRTAELARKTEALTGSNQQLQQEMAERQQIAERLRQSEIQYRLLAENAQDVIWTMDPQLNYTYISPSIQGLRGLSPQEAMAEPLRDSMTPESLDRVWQAHLERTTQEARGDFDGISRIEVEQYHRDGGTVWVEMVVRPLFDRDQNKIGYLGISRNISERKEYEAHLKAAKLRAEAASQAKSDFLANMSHELRTPLNAILGFVQIMRHSPSLSHEDLEHLSIIHRSGEHLLTLINQILDLSKLEANKMRLNPKDFDPRMMLEDLRGMFYFKVDEKNLDFQVETDPGLPRRIRADEVKLRQVLINLLNNAVKFTQEGGITVRTRTREDRIRFEVADTGPGIADEEMAELFEAFSQTHTGRSAQEGTGLGLSISRKFVEVMGGKLEVESQQGQGSCFTFDIPVEPAQNGEAEETPLLHPTEPDAKADAPYRILVADDDPDNRTLLAKWLAPLPVTLQEAADGEEALAICEQWHPHLIWMDIRMPGKAGYEAIQAIQAKNPSPKPVIVAITASRFDRRSDDTLPAAYDDFLQKPFAREAVLRIMESHLGLSPTDSKKGVHAPPDPENLSAIPSRILADLQDAASRADMTDVDELIETIQAQSPEVGRYLASLAHDFEYERILAYLSAI